MLLPPVIDGRHVVRSDTHVTLSFCCVFGGSRVLETATVHSGQGNDFNWAIGGTLLHIHVS